MVPNLKHPADDPSPSSDSNIGKDNQKDSYSIPKKIGISAEENALFGKIYRFLTQHNKPDINNITRSRIFRNNYALAREILVNMHTNQKRVSPVADGGARNTTIKTAKNENTTSKQADKLAELHRQVKNCDACFVAQLRGKSSPPSLPQRTATQGKTMVVVDQVSYFSQVVDQYFLDSAGEILKKIMIAVKINIDELYYTGLLKCSGAIEISDRLQEASVCLKYFFAELQFFSPKIVLIFGRDAYQLLFPQQQKEQSFDSIRGKILPYTSPDGIRTSLLFTHHPREIIRDSGLKLEVWNDLKPHIAVLSSTQ